MYYFPLFGVIAQCLVVIAHCLREGKMESWDPWTYHPVGKEPVSKHVQ